MSAGGHFGGLSRRSEIIIGAAILVGLLHHADHVLHFDHGGWPFRGSVNPFTFSLLAYPISLFARLRRSFNRHLAAQLTLALTKLGVSSFQH